jgi:MerR family transcriptional regulator, copper efflux regulator
MTTMKPLLIGQLARSANVGVETIRFYERSGLLGEPTRRRSGYRMYDQHAVTRLNFIRRAKQLGFTLSEIKELLAFQANPNATRAEVKAAAIAKVADIGERIRDLQRMRAALETLTDQCHGDEEPAVTCPILEALTQQADANATP